MTPPLSMCDPTTQQLNAVSKVRCRLEITERIESLQTLVSMFCIDLE